MSDVSVIDETVRQSVLRVLPQGCLPAPGEAPDVWRVEVSAECVRLHRLNAGGQVIEAYAWCSHAVAAVRLAAVVQGFEPPRGMAPLERVVPGGYEPIRAA